MNAVDVLGEAGVFAEHIHDFVPRVVQQQMAELVEQAIDHASELVVEAATGVGKTYAYSVPALLSGTKTIISTGSRHLQEQLFYRDLPEVARVLGININSALLKGRSNYLCLYRLEQLGQRIAQVHGEIAAAYPVVREWASLTRDGDVSEVNELEEQASIWPYVTSTVENCLGNQCSHYSDCYVVKARRAAQEADIVVVNHHLFFADMALKDEGFGEILPSANTFILDEAHQLPETASRFFGQSVSSRQLFDLTRETLVSATNDAADASELRDCSRSLEAAIREFRLSLGQFEQRKPWAQQWQQPKVQQAYQHLRQQIQALAEVLERHAERSEALENLSQRALLLDSKAAGFSQAQSDVVQWYEIRASGFVLHETPLEIAPIFREHMSRYQAAWVFTSATLSVGEAFEHFTEQLGLEAPTTACLPSPFDFKAHARLLAPKNLPEPGSPQHTQTLIDTALPLIKAAGGNTFLLFTSFKALRAAADYLECHPESQNQYQLLVQGSAPRSELLRQFREDTPSILLASSGFWEGVDIKGGDLRLVVIDKLPFAMPDDPVLQARFNALKAKGQNPFMTYQVPKAVIALKQGAGRLIRGVEDKGVLMLGDPRLRSKPYGRLFLQSLPAMTRTDDLLAAAAFLESL